MLIYHFGSRTNFFDINSLIYGSELEYLDPFTLIPLGGFVESISKQSCDCSWESALQSLRQRRRTLGSARKRFAHQPIESGIRGCMFRSRPKMTRIR